MMLSWKNLLATVVLGVSLLAAPVANAATVAPHKTTTKHVKKTPVKSTKAAKSAKTTKKAAKTTTKKAAGKTAAKKVTKSAKKPATKVKLHHPQLHTAK